MKTTVKFLKVLPVVAVLGLTACGGDGGDDSDTQGGTGSIVDCFTVNKTVNFAVLSSALPANAIPPTRSTTGLMTYNGQAVTGQTFFYPNGNTTYTDSTYWTTTNNGATLVAEVDYDGAVTIDGTFFPQNMNPGQGAIDSSNNISTFVGFETISLASKIFSNTCHFKAGKTDAWFAPGYGIIKRIADDGGIIQYNGNL
jgi:hypothetical protein